VKAVCDFPNEEKILTFITNKQTHKHTNTQTPTRARQNSSTRASTSPNNEISPFLSDVRQ
jgi:hypothetical protein